jgi:hypothetical protein
MHIRIPDIDMSKMPRMTAAEHAAVRQASEIAMHKPGREAAHRLWRIVGSDAKINGVRSAYCAQYASAARGRLAVPSHDGNISDLCMRKPAEAGFQS